MPRLAALLLSLLAPSAALLRGARAPSPLLSSRLVPRSPLRPLPSAQAAIGTNRAMRVEMSEIVDNKALASLKERLWGVGWLAWWSQIILSTISAVLLLFANRCETDTCVN